jgi:molecular chaperone DnaJ
MPIAKY